MKIKKQDIISWLLDNDAAFGNYHIGSRLTKAEDINEFLVLALQNLSFMKNEHFEWGLPEMPMPSFKDAMVKASKSFIKIESELFDEFCKNRECGILLLKRIGTVVYCFVQDILYVWMFQQQDNTSVLYLYFLAKSKDGSRVVGAHDNIHQVSAHSTLSGDDFYAQMISLIVSYVAVKRYAKVESIVIPNRKIDYLRNIIPDHKSKESVFNDSGQDVIIMDSSWFRRIVNDNDIFVRGFWRWQNKKNEKGEWYKELIFIDPFVRKGYHRNAKIENGSCGINESK